MAAADPNGIGIPLFDPPNAKVDIVFVHGLNGHRIKTWTSTPTKDIPTSVFWPKDLLPETCKTARILSFGYDSSFVHFYPLYGPKQVPVGTTIDDHSTALVQSLVGLRDATQSLDRPIIFIAHSLGGLVCANALSRQHSVNEASKQIMDNTCGLIFLGTPFEGSQKARWASLALCYLKLVSSTNDEKVKDLEERSQKLTSINDSFHKFLKDRDRSQTPVEIACFFEEYPTYVLSKKIGMIVPKDSAKLPGVDPLSISANHVNMCKFEDEYRNGYTSISNILSRWIRAFDARPTKGERNHSVCLGATIFHDKIDNNRGVVMGNAYTPAKDGIRVTGAITNYYGDSSQPAARKQDG